jgi:hypothetical protein
MTTSSLASGIKNSSAFDKAEGFPNEEKAALGMSKMRATVRQSESGAQLQ